MALAYIPCFLFLSLLSQSFLLVKCDVDDDDLLRGINQYRASLNLTPLNMAEKADCLADDIADSYNVNNQICTTTTAPNNTTLPKFSDYPTILTKCGLTTGGGQILAACIPEQQQNLNLVLTTFTTNYTSYLNSTQFSGIGIASDDNWIVIVLTNTTGGGSNGGSIDDDDDDLLRGINQYRASFNLTSLNFSNGVDCLADEIADTYNNRICTNTTAPYNTTLPKFSDYPGVLTKCGLTINATGEGQILPACIPSHQLSLGISRFIADYANFLNSTQFSDIGIGSEDDWVVVVLANTTAGGSNTAGGGNNTTGGGSNTTGGSPTTEDRRNGASSLAAISPAVFSIICLFMLF